mgnify:FL=1
MILLVAMVTFYNKENKMQLTQKEAAIVAELIDLNDVYFGRDWCKNPIEQVINDNPACFNSQLVDQNDFNKLYKKINKWRSK